MTHMSLYAITGYMISPENMHTLRRTSQEIIDNKKDFSEAIAPAIESVAQQAPDEWARARIRKLPVIAAFSNAFAVRAMTHIEQGIASTDDENAYETFLSLTEGVDAAASREAVAELLATGGTFSAASEDFKTQVEVMNHIAITEPALIQKRGKLAYVVAVDTPEEIANALVNPMAVNARGTTLSLIIGETLRLCLREGRLPASHELRQELGRKATNLADLSLQPTATFQLATGSKRLAQNLTQQIKRHNRVDGPASWPAILQEALTSGKILPAAFERGQPPHNESQTSRVLGHCAAQLCLKPASKDRATAASYSKKHSLRLNEGAFRVAEYQLQRGLEVAETTLFSDPACRTALVALAQYIRTGIK